MRVWRDGDLVIEARGRTLPRRDSVYNRLQVGITANGNRFDTNVVYIDDASIWEADPGWQ